MADTILATSACYYGKQMGVISVGQENLFWRPDGHLVYTFTLPYSDLQCKPSTKGGLRSCRC